MSRYLRNDAALNEQEAQLPQRNSASAAHMEGGLALQPTPPSPPPPTPMRMVESANPKPATNVRQACRPLSAL